MQIESGKHYLTRDGKKVGPMKDFGWEDGFPWSADGCSFYYSDAGESQSGGDDIVSEYPEGPVRTFPVTVMRSAIVSGHYSGVNVEVMPSGQVKVSFVTCTRDASHLYDASDVLYQMAEALEHD